MKYACPCCRNLTLAEPPPGTFQICPVCYWEDDPVQFADPAYAGGANKLSLLAARKNYVDFGASDPEFVKEVRLPRPDEQS
jgi:hypothetical protein